MMKSGAPMSMFSLSDWLILTMSTSLCVRSSSDFSPLSSVMLGRVVTGDTGNSVRRSDSGLPPLNPALFRSSSGILSRVIHCRKLHWLNQSASILFLGSGLFRCFLGSRLFSCSLRIRLCYFSN